MTLTTPEWCFCGLPLENGLCKRHKDKITREKRVLRGDFSGKSKSVNRFNDYA